MARTELKKVLEQASALAGQQITVCGWVKTIRDSKALGFIELNDGSSFSNLQVVFEDAKVPNFKEIAKCNVGTALRVTGTLTLTPNAKQPCEIHACEIVVEGVSARIIHCRKTPFLEYLRTIAHLRPRTNTFNAAFRVRSVAAFAIHRFFSTSGALSIPIRR